MNLLGMIVPYLAAFGVLMILGRLIASEAGEERRAVDGEGGRIEFTPNRRSYWGVYIFAALLAYVSITSLIGGGSVGLVPALLCTLFILFLLSAFPGSIVADEKGIAQVYWLRGERRIAWSDVRSVEVNEKKQEIRILGKGGVKILHARQLPDRDRLMELLKSHAAEKLPGAAVLKAEEAPRLTSAF
jgi:Bacterial PH domain